MATTNDGTANGEARGDNVLNQTSGEQGNKTNTAVNKQKQDHNNIATDSWGQEENGMVADEWKKYEGTKPENRKLFEEDTKSISSAVEEVNQFILPDGIVDGRNLEIELTTSPTGAPQNTFRYYRSASGTFQSTPVAKATAMSPEVEEPPCTHPTIDHVRMLSPEQIAASRLPRPVHPETNPVKCGVCEIEIRVRKGYKRCTWCLAIRCVKCQGTLKRK